MRLDEFTTALPLLPPPLRDRAEALRPHLSLNHCQRCRQISDAVNLALMATRYDEFGSALLPALPGVTFQHVKGHAGHPLNEAADSLSSMARRRLQEPFDLHGRAQDLVSAFLRDWHTASASA